MALSLLPLSYCTNVHPGRSVAEVQDGLDRYTIAVRDRFGHPLSAGLWLARSVVAELLQSPEELSRFAAGLRSRRLTCHTLNAFPYGDFHSVRVKENVYLPDWTKAERLEYTVQCAQVLATVLPDDTDGSISTLPLGFKPFRRPESFLSDAAHRLIDCAVRFDRLRQETGKLIRLAIEPEPLCVLETTSEAVSFFNQLWLWARERGAEKTVREHIGLCYDVCHQAVEFEDVHAGIVSLDDAGVRINKVHISCALQVDNPARNEQARLALRQYVEPRYLHQVIARQADGRLARAVDLDGNLIDRPGPGFSEADCWRIHFHVPVDADRLGPLTTTRPALKDALAAVARLDYAPHLEVETYTWEVLPGAQPADLVRGLACELTATQTLLSTLRIK